MAEYYPLLKRAVAGMPNASADARRAIYERARKALLGQLRAMQPPVPEPDIERESRALDAAIEQLERELAPAAAPAPSASAPAPAPTPAPAMRVAPAPAPVAAPPPPAPVTPPLPAAAPPRAPVTAPAPQAAPPPPVARASAPPPVAPAPAPAAPVAAPPVQRPVAPTPAAPVAPPAAPVAPPAAPIAPPRAAPPIQPRPPVARPAPPPPPAEATPALAAEPDEPPALDLESDLRARPLRPAAPAAPPATERRGVLRYVLVGMALALVLGGIGYAAYVLRDRPEEIARARPESAAPAPAGESSGKIVERIGGGGAPAPAAESTPIPTVRAPTTAIRPPGATPPPAAAPQTAPPAAAAPGVAVAQRSALLIENKQGGQPDVFIGTTVWRADQGVLRAEIEIPDARLKATMALQKNADLTLAASHTMELRFDAPAGDLAIGKVGAPELRREDMANGDRLAAVAVPIAAGYWLVGLARGERDVQYNLDLMRGRGWFDIPIQLADGRIAKLTFEKGAPGERALADASAAW